MQVRTENLYYLLCYAWNQLSARSLVHVGDVDARTPEGLFARVFISATEQLRKQRWDRGYLEFEEEARRPRGKINIATTVHRGLLQRGLVSSSHDDLTEDVLHNRLIKATALTLARFDNLSNADKARLRAVAREMPEVSDIRVSSSDFRRVQLHSNLRRYALVLHVCEFVHRCTLPDQKSGRLNFQSFVGNEQEMGKLFEIFLRSFLRIEQTAFPTVSARHVAWDLEGDDASLLPQMNTDIVLQRAGLRVVLEAKCYRTPTVTRFSGARGTLRSKDVYQLLSYVTNSKAAHPEERVVGALIYAVDNQELSSTRFSILGHAVHVVPINLDRPWREIHAVILAFIAEVGEGAGVRLGAPA